MKKEFEGRFHRKLSDIEQQPKVKAAVTDINADIRQLRKKMGETGAAISETALHAKDKAGDMISQGFKTAKDQGLHMEKIVTGYIKENPIKSIGFSILAGAILTLFWRRG
jgi:hypothetical protein